MNQRISYPFNHSGMSCNLERNENPVVIKTVHSGSECVIELQATAQIIPDDPARSNWRSNKNVVGKKRINEHTSQIAN